MGNIICSISIKRGIVAILIIERGSIKKRVVVKIKDEKIAGSPYTSMLFAFETALRHIRDYINTSSDLRDVCFETSNSIFIKWMDKQYSKEQYQEDFVRIFTMLQELPIRYQFSYSARPKAFQFTDAKYIEKQSLSGLDLSMED